MHGTAVDPQDGSAIDEVLAVRMPGPKSYTGEDVCEIQAHGSPVVVEAILDAALRAGARAAERGEFTRRAVINGRIDLLQAEAIADLIDARVHAGAQLAWSQLQGALSDQLAALRHLVKRVLVEIEANIDFSDDELPCENLPARIETLDTAAAGVAVLLEGFVTARRYREGFRTVLVGRPNVGKSSLVNALLGRGRMIVSDEPGTTRDSVEETVDLGGTAFVLTDTAGVRATESTAEREAVARTREIAANADILLVILDGSQPLTDEDRELCLCRPDAADATRLFVVNKSDLPSRLTEHDEQCVAGLSAEGEAAVRLSAKSGEGCAELVVAMKQAARAAVDGRAPAGLSRARHRSALTRVAAGLVRARRTAAADGEPELCALELRDVLRELAAISTPMDNDEILEAIFGEFCIGK